MGDTSDMTARQSKLDELDLKILSLLQEHGRMTNVELARRVGISAPPCLRRMRALEDARFIRGYHAEVSPEALNFSVTVFAMIGLSSQSEADLSAFEAKVSEWPLVRECYMLTGEADYMLKVVAHDWDEYQNFVTRELTATPNVSHVKTAMTLKVSKNLPGIPISSNTDDP